MLLTQLTQDKGVSNYYIPKNQDEKRAILEVFERVVIRRHDTDVWIAKTFDEMQEVILLVKRNQIDKETYFHKNIIHVYPVNETTLEDILMNKSIANYGVSMHYECFCEIINVFVRFSLPDITIAYMKIDDMYIALLLLEIDQTILEKIEE